MLRWNDFFLFYMDICYFNIHFFDDCKLKRQINSFIFVNPMIKSNEASFSKTNKFSFIFAQIL
jgi:hypothetical protein